MFRGSAEVTKRIRQCALVLELVAAVIAAYGGLSGDVLWGGWASLVLVLLMAAATGLRIWSRGTHSHSERCRRISARAFAQGRDVESAVKSGLKSDAPLLTEYAAKKLPAGTLEAYYEPTKSPGTARLQEMYAHSSFFSWRLLRTSGTLFVAVGVAVMIMGIAVIYGLAVEQPPATAAGRVLDVVCSLVFGALSVKAFDTGIAACVASRDARVVADGLIGTSDEAQILEFALQYDMERVSGPLVPTLIYRLRRTTLEKEWCERRLALDEMP
jgi:hypothetical protein